MTELPSEPSSQHPPFGRFSETTELDLRRYWQVLVRRRRLILSCVAITVGVVMTVTLLTTPRYRAIATIQIQPHGPDILTFKDVVPDTSFMGYQNYYQTQYKILQSRAVLRLAAERLDLTNRPEYAGRRRPPVSRLAAWLTTRLGGAAPADRSPEDPLEPGIRFIAERLEVEPVRNSHLVRVKALDRDPVLARDLANAVSDAYQQFSLSVKY